MTPLRRGRPSRPEDEQSAADDGRPAPGRRERQRLATRERIYQVAIAEFERVGFAEAQIDRIVDRAGVARGTFYFHFRTKEHVLLELQHRAQDEIVAHLAASGRPPDSVPAFCRGVYEAILAGGDEHPSLRREILAMYVRRNIPVELSAESLLVHVVDYFADAAERGAVRRDVPPERLAVLFLGGLFVHLMGDELDDDQDDGLVDTAIEIFARGARP